MNAERVGHLRHRLILIDQAQGEDDLLGRELRLVAKFDAALYLVKPFRCYSNPMLRLARRDPPTEQVSPLSADPD